MTSECNGRVGGRDGGDSPQEDDQQTLLVSSPWPATIVSVDSSPITRNSPAIFDPTSPTDSYKSTRSRSIRPDARKPRRRILLKNGFCNVIQRNLSRQNHLVYLQDIFTSLIDAQWRWTLLIFAFSFIGSWLFFGAIYYLICYAHGDLDEDHLPHRQAETGWSPCVFNIYTYTSAFLFSMETQTTIGYGVRATTEECPEAIFTMVLQSVWGPFIQAFMVGIVFAKMTRPKHRAQTLIFSKHAVIATRNGELCLMFRIGDIRKSHIICSNIRAQLVRTRQTREGEVIPQYRTELELTSDQTGSDIFFIWPVIVVHKINETSPFYKMSATDLLQERFEILVFLEGTVESTGQTTQARSSYLNSEILWGHRFEPINHYNTERHSYETNYKLFNHTVQIDTPLCSAKELEEYYKMKDDPDGEESFRGSIGGSFMILRSPKKPDDKKE